MLAGMKPGEFDELYRDYLERPWGDEWLLMSQGVTAIINEIRQQLCADIKDDQLLPADALVPKAPADDEKEPAQGLGRSLAIMRASIGV